MLLIYFYFILNIEKINKNKRIKNDYNLFIN